MNNGFIVVVLSVFIAACTPHTAQLIEKADTLAQQHHFERALIQGGDFQFYTQARIAGGSQAAIVYIEGDGRAWLSRTRPSLNPTPQKPLALYLATADNRYDSIVYLARPCQFMMAGDDPACQQKYWTGSRYAEEIIAAYDMLLDELKQRHRFKQFHFVGFSGGATVAALLASRRDDVVSLRTVAGNLDTVAFTRIHRVSPTKDSLNPVDVAARLVDLPQRHYIGISDHVVPRDLADAFVFAMGEPHCADVEMKEAEHIEGWSALWPSLINEPLPCEKVMAY